MLKKLLSLLDQTVRISGPYWLGDDDVSANLTEGAKPMLIATIYGVPVYSDKPVRNIINTRIEFEDGSWADVATGTVRNVGPGSISLGSQPDSDAAPPVTVGPHMYEGTRLNVSNIAGSIEIVPGGDKIVVTVSGSKSLVDDVIVRQAGGEVSIRGGGEKTHGGGIVCASGRGSIAVGCNIVGGDVFIGNIAVNGDHVVIGGRTREPDMRVRIEVPTGMELCILDIAGDITIGDTAGPLTLRCNGHRRATIGRVGPTVIDAEGHSRVTIAEVHGAVSASLAGHARIMARGGAVRTLEVASEGHGTFDFGGRAARASLSASGHGKINVSYVRDRPTRSCYGHGKVTIGNW